MSTAMQTRPTTGIAIEDVLIRGDIKSMTEPQRVEYYGTVCRSLGLNPLTKPFEYLTLNGKLLLYARRDATDQLRKLHNVSIEILARECMQDVYVVTARATLPSGRTDESIGAVAIKGLVGDALANAYMKTETKAKRRVTLSVCGLGMLDETEVETISETPRAAPSICEADKNDGQPCGRTATMVTPDGRALCGIHKHQQPPSSDLVAWRKRITGGGVTAEEIDAIEDDMLRGQVWAIHHEQNTTQHPAYIRWEAAMRDCVSLEELNAAAAGIKGDGEVTTLVKMALSALYLRRREALRPPHDIITGEVTREPSEEDAP